MPLTLNNTGTGFNSSVNVPLPGEARTAISVRDAPQKHLDSLHNINSRLIELLGRSPAAAINGVELRCFPRQIAASSWVLARGVDEAGAATVPVLTQSVADTDECLLEIPGIECTGDPIAGGIGSAQITKIGIVVLGNNHGALPAVMPQLRLMSIAPGKAYAGTDGRWPTPTEDAAIVDPTGTHAAYDQVHLIELTGLSLTTHDIDRKYIRVRGESGANAAAGRFQIGWVYSLVRSAGGTFP